MKKGAIFANRLALLRNEKGINQEDLGKIISEAENRLKAYSYLSVSGWETGDKYPPLSTFVYLCDYFDVSADYLLGRSNDPKNGSVAKAVPGKVKSKNTPDYLVTFNDLPQFDGEPIYVVFNDKKASDRWGILDWTKRQVAFTGSYLVLTKELNCTYYSQIPETQRVPKYNLKKRLSMSQILSSENVWVQMITSDEKIRGQYNGWYRNNENKTCLINLLGLTLPYEGLNISFNAFSAEF